MPMDSQRSLGQSNFTIFWAFPALLVSYAVFLSNLGYVFNGLIEHNPILSKMDAILSFVFTIQFIALLTAALLVSGTLILRAHRPSDRWLNWLPLASMLLSPVALLHFWSCAFEGVSGEACAVPSFLGDWENLVYFLFLFGLLVVGLASWRRELSEGVQRLVLVLLGIVSLGMVFQMVDVFSWGITAWPTDQATVIRLAFSSGHYHHLWIGNWHVALVIGMILVAICGGLALIAAERGLSILLKKS